MSLRPVVRSYGDSGLLIEFDDGDREHRWRAAQELGTQLRASRPTGLLDVVASFTSVFAAFDPLITDIAMLTAVIESATGAEPDPPESRLFLLPVVYGGSFGPDLSSVADHLGMSSTEVVDRHTGEPWLVRFVGSPAGAPLMDGPTLPASVPRLAAPRSRLDPGSVGLSGQQCIVYNAPSPGGWQLIGRTPLRMFDVDTPPHVAYRSGDRIRFTPIPASDWDHWAERPIEPAPPTGA